MHETSPANVINGQRQQARKWQLPRANWCNRGWLVKSVNRKRISMMKQWRRKKSKLNLIKRNNNFAPITIENCLTKFIKLQIKNNGTIQPEIQKSLVVSVSTLKNQSNIPKFEWENRICRSVFGKCIWVANSHRVTQSGRVWRHIFSSKANVQYANVCLCVVGQDKS